MTDESRSIPETDAANADVPANEVLPEVTPPSAGFIVQLFLVPAVIVMAIVGVWALFGQLAATGHDWQELIVELRSNNKHRRDRAMLSLAQMIEADRALGAEGESLSANPEVAEALVDVFRERLAGTPEVDTRRIPKGEQGDDFRRRREETREQERLKALSTTARALGLLDSPEIVCPALLEGTDPDYDVEVRKDCINSISVIANRATEEENEARLARVAETPGLIDTLIDISGEVGEDGGDLMRDTATYALGLLPVDEARDRLAVLAEHRSPETRYNAAVGLARQKSTVGLPVFASILEEASTIEEAEAVGAPPKTNLLLVTLLAATFTALIMAAMNKGAVRYVGTGLSVALLIGAGVVAAGDAEERSDDGKPQVDARVVEERRVERVLALHAVQNSLKATEKLAPEMSASERDRFVALVEPIADSHPEPRLRVDAAKTLNALRSAG